MAAAVCQFIIFSNLLCRIQSWFFFKTYSWLSGIMEIQRYLGMFEFCGT